jgi:RNA polymerase sigma factor (sigma-70 family)
MNRFGFSSRTTLPIGTPRDNRVSQFEQLALPLLDSAYNFAYWLSQDRENAEDLVQEAYLKALRGFSSFRPGSNFRAWMFQILKNTFLSSYSEAKRARTVSIDSDEVSPLLPVTSESAETMLVDRSGSEPIRRAIEQLPIAFREVILLCDVEDASYREIAEILSVPIGTVMSRLARARRAVRESISRGAQQRTNGLLASQAANRPS